MILYVDNYKGFTDTFIPIKNVNFWSKKKYVAIMVGEKISIPSDFEPIKTVIYRPH